MVKRDLIRNILLVLLALFSLILLRIFIFATHQVKDDLQNPYLKSGDLITITKNEKPSIKDFVIYQVEGKEYLGRIVAKPGQTVTYMDDIFYRNQQIVTEDYLEASKMAYLSQVADGTPYTADFTLASLTQSNLELIPDNHYLILNDNRQDLTDSRTFGLIKSSQIKGVVTFRLLPLSDFGFVKVD